MTRFANAAADQRRKPNRKRGHFVGVWLDDAEHAKVELLAYVAGEPDNLSAGLRYALRHTFVVGEQ